MWVVRNPAKIEQHTAAKERKYRDTKAEQRKRTRESEVEPFKKHGPWNVKQPEQQSGTDAGSLLLRVKEKQGLVSPCACLQLARH